jgi:Mn-dependent DtxR family transcriptional regulator
MGRKGLILSPTPILLVAIAIMVSSFQVAAQEERPLLDPDEIGTEVLLNDPEVIFDADPLFELWGEGYINIPGMEPPVDMYWFSKGPFLYLSHHDPGLGVLIGWENLSVRLEEMGIKDYSLEGYTVSIVIPCTVDLDNFTPGESVKFRPDVEINIDSIDWTKAMEVELQWLVSIGVISGLGPDYIEKISSLSERGNMGPDNRILFHHNSTSWELYDETGLPDIPLIFGDPTPHSRSEFPDSVAPTPRGEQEGAALGLISIITASFAVLFVLGTLFYYRANRALKINNARRRLIYETIRNDPGVHFRKIMKELDLKPGVASYHLNKLEKEEHIKSFQDGMYRRFYPFEEKVEMKVMLSDMQTLIIDVIKEEPGISQVDISKMIGKSKVVINYHVRFLRDLGILALEREGRTTHCFLTARGTDIASG